MTDYGIRERYQLVKVTNVNIFNIEGVEKSRRELMYKTIQQYIEQFGLKHRVSPTVITMQANDLASLREYVREEHNQYVKSNRSEKVDDPGYSNKFGYKGITFVSGCNLSQGWIVIQYWGKDPKVVSGHD